MVQTNLELPHSGDSALRHRRKDLLQDLAQLDDSPATKFVGCYLLTILPLALCAVLLASWSHPAAWVLFAIVAGLTQNALGVLMHEGSHYFFHRHRRWNDVLANVLVCLPIFNTVQGYRRHHFDHHRHSGATLDPYHELYGKYRTKGDVWRALLADLSGITAVRSFLKRYAASDPGTRDGNHLWLSALLAEQAIIAGALCWLTGSPLGWVFLWVLPVMTIPFAINRARTVAEHCPGRDGPANRTTRVGIFEYLCVAPYGYSHHFEHHLAPNVPYYRLAWAHAYLRDRAVRLRAQEYNDDGYLRTFARFLTELDASSRRG